MTLVLDVPTETTAPDARPSDVTERPLLERLADWTGPGLHGARELADEVLLADGWQCKPNPKVKGGILWVREGAPVQMIAEAYRPHPIKNLIAARALVPDGYSFSLHSDGGRVTAAVWQTGLGLDSAHWGFHRSEPVALVIAALRARQAAAQLAMLDRPMGSA